MLLDFSLSLVEMTELFTFSTACSDAYNIF